MIFIILILQILDSIYMDDLSTFCIVQIDSVMSTRVANENDASRRLKSEFLVQFDGVTSNSNDLVIVIGILSNINVVP